MFYCMQRNGLVLEVYSQVLGMLSLLALSLKVWLGGLNFISVVIEIILESTYDVLLRTYSQIDPTSAVTPC